MILIDRNKFRIWKLVIFIISLLLFIYSISYLFLPTSLLFTFSFLLSIEVISFFGNNIIKGRSDFYDTLKWLVFFLISIITLIIFFFITILLFKAFIEYPNPIRAHILYYFLMIFYACPFIGLLYRRTQDFGLPGFYILGSLPILNFVYGIKTFKSGKKVLGIIIFFNFSLIIPYILFFKGDVGTNYFGINKNKIREYIKDRKHIFKSEFLNNNEKKELLEKLIEKYKNEEELQLSSFKEHEINILTNRIQENFRNISPDNSSFLNEDFLNRIKLNKQNYVETKISKYYKYIDWNKIN